MTDLNEILSLARDKVLRETALTNVCAERLYEANDALVTAKDLHDDARAALIAEGRTTGKNAEEREANLHQALLPKLADLRQAEALVALRKLHLATAERNLAASALALRSIMVEASRAQALASSDEQA